MNYSIKLSAEKDIPFLWEMLHQSIFVPEGHPAPSIDILKEPNIEKYLINWGKENDHALVAIDKENNAVGAVWIRLLDQDNAGYGFVDENTPELGMAIRNQYRGKGIGKNLLFNMIQFAHSIGYPAISLSVDPLNQNALRLYEKSGFIKVYEDAGGSWIMKRDL